MKIMDDFIRQLEGPTVVVCVGPTEKRRDFKVAKDLLFEKSEWFKNALKDERFVEGQLNIIELPEDSASVFAAFYYFILHHDELAFKGVCVQDNGIEACCEQLKLCIDIWIFGDKIGMHELQNAAMKRACFIIEECDIEKVAIPGAVLEACFSKTLQDSPMQVLAADYVVKCMATEPEKCAQLLSHLATIEGFVSALQTSQAKYHEALYAEYVGFTFPRYLDFYKNQDVLLVTPRKPGQPQLYTYDGQIDPGHVQCFDCAEVVDGSDWMCLSCLQGSNEGEVAALPLCEACAYNRESQSTQNAST